MGAEEEKKGEKEKKDAKSITVVLNVNLHCSGCISRIRKVLYSFNGVETVKDEADKNKLTVVGTVDPVKLRDKLEKRTKKKVELISPLPKKEKDVDGRGGGGGEASQKKGDGGGKDEQKQGDRKKANKEPPVVTVVLKVAWHCDGCARKIRKIVSTFKGVQGMSIDREKDMVTVKGTMDVKALVECLKEKLKRSVEVVPEKKEKDKEGSGGGDGGGGKKKGGGGGGGDKEGGSGGGGDGGKGPANRFEYVVVGSGYGYRDVGSGYVMDLLHAPQLFSDENANGCAIM